MIDTVQFVHMIDTEQFVHMIDTEQFVHTIDTEQSVHMIDTEQSVHMTDTEQFTLSFIHAFINPHSIIHQTTVTVNDHFIQFPAVTGAHNPPSAHFKCHITCYCGQLSTAIS